MAFSTAAKNAMIDAITANAVKVSAHSGDPGATGANNELAVTRQTLTWAAASGGSASISNTPVFTITAGMTVSFLGVWNSAGSIFYGSCDVTDEVFGGDGTYTLDTLAFSIT